MTASRVVLLNIVVLSVVTLDAIMLSVVMLSVVMPSVIKLSVVALLFHMRPIFPFLVFCEDFFFVNGENFEFEPFINEF